MAINTRHVALRNDAWRAEALHVRREYAKTRYDIPLFKLHELDPTKVLHLCVANCLPSDEARRYDLARLYTFPDDVSGKCSNCDDENEREHFSSRPFPNICCETCAIRSVGLV